MNFKEVFFIRQFHPLIFALIMIAILGLLLGSWYYFEDYSRKGISSKLEVKPSPSIFEASESAEIGTPVGDLRIKILNGSGKSGQAAKTKSLLSGLGFISFELGNSEDSDGEKTLVYFSDRVSEELKSRIFKSLEDVYTDVEIDQKLEGDGVDILIITGLENE